ncbi:hypothetical protein DF060_27615 [Burkholderia pseudomallei]|nr:hypothetical protein DF127_25765 [Burkholderia pseudomallei]RPE17729.1 hypothetical protein DF068_28295 [Burkholderia pseudomallei]RQS87546.1 hypothetical protein DF125_25175 [Burkholderia pseudomallei]RQZ47246.1 hypothetical protein DF060_27615 [Burkholderia pseudomallei]
MGFGTERRYDNWTLKLVVLQQAIEQIIGRPNTRGCCVLQLIMGRCQMLHVVGNCIDLPRRLECRYSQYGMLLPTPQRLLLLERLPKARLLISKEEHRLPLRQFGEVSHKTMD